MKDLEKLAVDANPMLSALMGGRARAVFLAGKTAFYTTAFNYKEVEKYIPILALKRGLSPEDLYLAFSMLPVAVYDEDFYAPSLRRAKSLIAKRDPDDCHLLALAIELKCPLWSNDKDFEGCGVKVYTTTDLLRQWGAV